MDQEIFHRIVGILQHANLLSKITKRRFRKAARQDYIGAALAMLLKRRVVSYDAEHFYTDDDISSLLILFAEATQGEWTPQNLRVAWGDFSIGEATIEFDFQDRHHIWTFAQQSDWVDPEFYERLNTFTRKHLSGDFVLMPVIDQCALYLYLPRPIIKDITFLLTLYEIFEQAQPTLLDPAQFLQLYETMQQYGLLTTLREQQLRQLAESSHIAEWAKTLLPRRYVSHYAHWASSWHAYKKLLEQFAWATAGEWTLDNLHTSYNEEQQIVSITFDFRNEPISWVYKESSAIIGDAFHEQLTHFSRVHLSGDFIQLLTTDQYVSYLYLPNVAVEDIVPLLPMTKEDSTSDERQIHNNGLLLLTYNEHHGPTRQVRWSPDGKYIALVSDWEKLVEVWEVAKGRLMTWYPSDTYVYSIAWSPNSRYIALAEYNTIKIWDVHTDSIIQELDGFTIATQKPLAALAWSPDNDYLAFGVGENCVYIKHAFTGVTQSFYGEHTRPITAIVWSPDCQYVASAGEDAQVYIWHARTGETFTTYHGHTASVWSVAWSPDGASLVSGSEDTTSQIWSFLTGEKQLTYQGHADPLTCVAWSPDGIYIASADTGGVMHAWEAATGTKSSECMHSHSVAGLSWSPDSALIASASYGSLITNGTTGEIIAHYGEHPDIDTIAVASDGSYLASTSHDETQVWSALTGQKRCVYHGQMKEKEHIGIVAWSPDGAYIASAGGAWSRPDEQSGWGRIEIWSARETTFGECLCDWYSHSTHISALAWSPDSQFLASASQDGKVQTWQATTGQHLLTYHSNSSWVKDVAWSPNGIYIASTTSNNTVHVWYAATGETLTIYTGHTRPVWSLAWSPDSAYLASGGEDLTVRVWNISTGDTIHTYDGCQGRVTSVAWSPDGCSIAAGSWGKTVQVWDSCANDPRPKYIYQGHTRGVNKVAWFPDSKRLASASNEVHIIDMS